MKNPRHRFAVRPRALSALALSAIAATTHAATATHWAPTATKAHDPRGAVHIAAMREGEPVHVVMSLRLRNKPQLDALASRLMAHADERPISSAEFMRTYAPTADQARRVADYLRSQGFSHVQIAPNRLLVEAQGTAGSIKSAFQAEMHEYDVGGRRAFANTTDARVPARLADTVLAVVGLQTVHLARIHAKRLEAGSGMHPLAVTPVDIPDFESIYGASTLPSATGATIGIITQGDVTQTIADLQGFAASAGYPVPPVSTTVVGTPSSDTSGIDEWNMDTQSSLAAAGGTIQSMVLYDVNSLSDADLTSGFNRAVSDNVARAINVSLGGCETDEGSVESTDDQIFEVAVAQGQTFSVSSGDSGAWECGTAAGKAQSYPAVSPYVMAIGGTTLSTAHGNAWSGETVWSCKSAADCQQSSNGGAGGGPSLTESAPSWQSAAGVLGGSTMRGVPDISLDASPNSGALVLINGSLAQIGGTSLAAPLFTGFWSRIQSANGNTLPFPAPTLYQDAASHPQWFHDVTSGSQGFRASRGWDFASGYGSIQVANLASGFADSGSDAGPGYSRISFDISSVAAAQRGKPLTIRVSGSEGALDPTSFVLDDVSLKTN